MPKITEMYAFVAEENGPDDEGIVAASIGGYMFPLTGADMTRVDSLRPYAQRAARVSGKKVKLIHFTNREELEVIE